MRVAPGPRRPGPRGGPLRVLTWVGLGVALVAYVVGVLALAFLAVLIATLRLLLAPPLAAIGRWTGWSAPVPERRGPAGT